MTRDEAVAVVSRGGNPHDDITITAAVFVDLLRFLKVLKLDEPRPSASVLRKAEQALRVAMQVGRPDDPMDAIDIIGCLDDAGLKLVEK